jgi:hypothetical protein
MGMLQALQAKVLAFGQIANLRAVVECAFGMVNAFLLLPRDWPNQV